MGIGSWVFRCLWENMSKDQTEVPWDSYGLFMDRNKEIVGKSCQYLTNIVIRNLYAQQNRSLLLLMILLMVLLFVFVLPRCSSVRNEWVYLHSNRVFNLVADGRVGAGTVLCGDPVSGQFLREHLHAGSGLAPPAAVSRLVPLDHRSHCGYLAHPACGVNTSLPFT